MILFLIALSLLSWAALVPMLRDDRSRLYPILAPATTFSIPDATFDSRGLT